MKKKSHKLKEFFRKLYQKKWVRGFVYSLMVLGLPGLGAYMHWIEPRKIKTSKIKLSIKKKLPGLKGLKIAQISDLHFGPTNNTPKYFQKCIQQINHLNPDLICLTGDYMQWSSDQAPQLAEFLSELKARLGVFAVLGNHDYGVCHPGHPPDDPVNHEHIIEAFEKVGISVLHNQKSTLFHQNHPIDVVGVGDYWTTHFDPQGAFLHQEHEDRLVIVLSHNPDSIHSLSTYSFDLMLSGHVHGGQISFPWIGPLVVPVKERHLRRGLHRLYDRWLYTNRGLGFIFKARLLSPPEISLLEIEIEEKETPSA